MAGIEEEERPGVATAAVTGFGKRSTSSRETRGTSCSKAGRRGVSVMINGVGEDVEARGVRRDLKGETQNKMGPHTTHSKFEKNMKVTFDDEYSLSKRDASVRERENDEHEQ